MSRTRMSFNAKPPSALQLVGRCLTDALTGQPDLLGQTNCFTNHR